MNQNPETVTQPSAHSSRREFLTRLVPNLDLAPSTPIESPLTPISRRSSLQFLTAILIGGGVALSRDSIVWAGKNKGNTKNRTGSGDTPDEKAKRQAKKGNEGRKKGKGNGNNGNEPQKSQIGSEQRCAQGVVNIYNPVDGRTATLPDSCADLPAGWVKGTPGRSR